MVKAMFFDIDGTLVDPQSGRISDAVKDAVAQIQRNGVVPVLISGRPPLSISPVAEELSIDHFIAFNGGLTVSQGDIVDKNVMDKTTVAELVATSATLSHPLVFPGLTDTYTTCEDDSVREQLAKTFGWESLIAKPEYWTTNDVYQIELICEPASIQRYMDDFGQSLHFYPWTVMKNATNVNPMNTSKAIAMMKLLNHLGIDLRHSAAVGDGPNDVEMIETAQIGIAMGNACETLKAAADYVTEDVREDGVIGALRYCNLL